MRAPSDQSTPVSGRVGMLVRSIEVVPGDLIRDFGDLREVTRVDAGGGAEEHFIRLYLAPRAGFPESLLVRREVAIYVRRLTQLAAGAAPLAQVMASPQPRGA